MKNYKIIQRYYNLVTNHDDIFSVADEDILIDDQEIINSAIDYFKVDQIKFKFPSKSYAVALIYSRLIEMHFGTDFFESLNDEDLFCGTDRFFSPYSQSPHIYQAILQKVPIQSKNFNWPTHLYQVDQTIKYFELEFNLSGPAVFR